MQVCRTYGFSVKYIPCIYTLEGKLIGNGGDFFDHIRESYSIPGLSIDQFMQDRRKRDNIDIISEEVRKKKLGLNLTEKIDKELDKVKKKKVISHLTDSFYEQTHENGSNFFLRRTDLLRENGRLLDIPDEIEVEE